jgi:hypothetical protein
MKLNFDKTGAVRQDIGSSITFWDYPNESYLVEVEGYYYAIVYSNGDSIYLRHTNDEYVVYKIYTADGLPFLYEENKS